MKNGLGVHRAVSTEIRDDIWECCTHKTGEDLDTERKIIVNAAKRIVEAEEQQQRIYKSTGVWKTDYSYTISDAVKEINKLLK
ncbi:MAG: hypothetical protein AB1489_39420 [Acidobacteriota bacterium]